MPKPGWLFINRPATVHISGLDAIQGRSITGITRKLLSNKRTTRKHVDYRTFTEQNKIAKDGPVHQRAAPANASWILIGVGKSGCAGLPSLQTVRAVLPHTAI